MKNENAKKIIIIALVVLVAIIGTVLVLNLTSNEENNGESLNSSTTTSSIENNNEDNISEGTTKYINETANSKDKLAALFIGKVVVTIDDVDIVSKFEDNIGTEKVFYDYYDNYTDPMLTINTLGEGGWNNITRDMYYDIDDENKSSSERIVYEDGKWYLTQGKVYDKDIMQYVEGYKIYYRLAENSWTSDYYVIAKPCVSTDDEAIQILNKCKNNVNLYYIDETTGDYLTGIDNDKNKVDLSGYTFVNDILAKMLREEGLAVKDSTYIHSIKKYVVKVYPKLDNTNRHFYIDLDAIVLSDVKETFKLNGKKVSLTKNGRFVIEGKKGEIEVTTMSEDWTTDPFTKEDFIKAFK